MNKDNLLKIVEKFDTGKVLVIGDIMLDSYMQGSVERISPEAPVPVVKVNEQHNLLGGSGNVAVNIAALGGNVTLISLCGNDENSNELESLLIKNNIKPILLKSAKRRTTVKTRIMSQRQQMLRLDYEDDFDLDNTELSLILDYIQQEVDNFEIIILSDYAKGLFNQKFIDAFNDIFKNRTKKPFILVDPKPNNFVLFENVNLITPNLKELSLGAKTQINGKKDILLAGNNVKNKLKLDNLLVTLGADGMALFSENKVTHIPTLAQDVFDVTGAGDTVIATIALALSCGSDMLSACILSNFAAGIVVSRVGAASVTQREISESLDKFNLIYDYWV